MSRIFSRPTYTSMHARLSGLWRAQSKHWPLSSRPTSCETVTRTLAAAVSLNRRHLVAIRQHYSYTNY